MRTASRLFLVGPMGAGKTTIGRLLARDLGLAFVDSDHVIEERCGADIPWIFDVEGEAGFRDREERAIDELTRRDNIVLATGGGAVMRPANRSALSTRGTVIYLHTPVKQQIARTSKDRNRPLLQGDNPGQVLRDLFALRDPLYREVADLVIETSGRNARSMAGEILRRLQSD